MTGQFAFEVGTKVVGKTGCTEEEEEDVMLCGWERAQLDNSQISMWTQEMPENARGKCMWANTI